VSRKIGKDLSGRFVAEASQSCSIVIGNEAVEEGVAIGVRCEGALGRAAFGFKSDGLAYATVEAFDQAVGLRPVGPNETVEDASFGAEFVEGMVAGRLILRLVLHVDGEAVGELTAVVGEDGVHRMGEVCQKSFQKSGSGFGIAARMDLDIDEACNAVDGDEGVAFFAFERRQVFEVNVDEADWRGLEGSDRHFRLRRSLGDAVTCKAAMDGAARQPLVDTAAHHLSDIVEGELQALSQFADQLLLHRSETDRQAFWGVRVVVDSGPTFPPPYRRLTYAELVGKHGYREGACLNVGALLRRRRRVSVQSQLHDARRSFTKATPRSIPIRSKQSSGTKHQWRGAENTILMPFGTIRLANEAGALTG